MYILKLNFFGQCRVLLLVFYERGYSLSVLDLRLVYPLFSMLEVSMHRSHNNISSGAARGRTIRQLSNDSKVIAQEFFEMLPIAQCRKILIHMYVRRSKWCYRNTMSLVMI
jgi:hypothetical protein